MTAVAVAGFICVIAALVLGWFIRGQWDDPQNMNGTTPPFDIPEKPL